MTPTNLKSALGFYAAIILAGAVTTMAYSRDGTGGDLSASEIFKKAQEKYASLTGYSDEGKVVATLNGSIITTTFTIKLARPKLYRVEWEQNNETSTTIIKTKPQKVWSAGEGDFLEMGDGPMKQPMALGGATGISGGAAATIPGTFFKMNWGNQLAGSIANEKRQTDEKLGNVDCYVFASDLKKGQTRTLWIGKGDFLIHQVCNTTSADAMKASLAQTAKLHPEMNARLQPFETQGLISTETHSNIVINQTFSPSDFAP